MPAPLIKEISRANTKDHAVIVLKIGIRIVAVVATISDDGPIMNWKVEKAKATK